MKKSIKKEANSSWKKSDQLFPSHSVWFTGFTPNSVMMCCIQDLDGQRILCDCSTHTSHTKTHTKPVWEISSVDSVLIY